MKKDAAGDAVPGGDQRSPRTRRCRARTTRPRPRTLHPRTWKCRWRCRRRWTCRCRWRCKRRSDVQGRRSAAGRQRAGPVWRQGQSCSQRCGVRLGKLRRWRLLRHRLHGSLLGLQPVRSRWACARPSRPTRCAPPPCCSEGVARAESRCNGTGQCVAGVTTACGAYACYATFCGSACLAPSDCAPPFTCSQHRVRLVRAAAALDLRRDQRQHGPGRVGQRTNRHHDWWRFQPPATFASTWRR